MLYQARLKPKWLRRPTGDQSQGIIRYGIIEGIDPDKIAYATQASEAVCIMANQVEVKADIMRENYDHTDENMYIGFNRDGVAQLSKAFPDLSNSNKAYEHVKIEFEVKHLYFDNLIRAVNKINPIVIQRLVPQPQDFLPKPSTFFQYQHGTMHTVIAQLDPDDQLNALRTIAQCPAQSPPILINGSFGTGKTRVLAFAAYYITQMAREPVRVLVCAHHQASADHFVSSYFGELRTNMKYSWQVRLIRLTSPSYRIHNAQFSKFFMNAQQLHKEVQLGRISTTSGNLVIATTFLTALRLHSMLVPGFFTHILLDEGAQTREAETIASLSLATSGTKIVIAGDSCQVR